MSSTPTSQSVQSADGTRIAFDGLGEGPPVILVDQAGHYPRAKEYRGVSTHKEE